ncbi:hypothetical protein ACFL6C_08265 [Myxococcota bacterium]
MNRWIDLLSMAGVSLWLLIAVNLLAMGAALAWAIVAAIGRKAPFLGLVVCIVVPILTAALLAQAEICGAEAAVQAQGDSLVVVAPYFATVLLVRSLVFWALALPALIMGVGAAIAVIKVPFAGPLRWIAGGVCVLAMTVPSVAHGVMAFQPLFGVGKAAVYVLLGGLALFVGAHRQDSGRPSAMYGLGIAVVLFALSVAGETAAIAVAQMSMLREMGMMGSGIVDSIETGLEQLRSLSLVRALPMVAAGAWTIGNLLFLPTKLRLKPAILASLLAVGAAGTWLALSGDPLPIVLQGLRAP